MEKQEITRNEAPVLYHLLHTFNITPRSVKYLLQFLIQNKIYTPFLGRITQYRFDGRDNQCHLDEVEYSDHYLHDYSDIFFFGFSWNGSIPSAQIYIDHYNSMLPYGLTWRNIDAKWRRHCVGI